MFSLLLFNETLAFSLFRSYTICIKVLNNGKGATLLFQKAK